MRALSDQERAMRDEYDEAIAEQQRRAAQQAEFAKEEMKRQEAMTRFAPRPGLGDDKDKSKDDTDALDRFINTIEKEAAAKRAEADAFFKSAEAKREDINLAKAKAIADQNDIELTEEKRKKIIAASDAEVAANKKTEELQGVKDAWKSIGDTVEQSIDQVIVQGQKLNDVFKNLAKTLESQALQAVLTGGGPLAAIFGTKSKDGGLGGLFGAIFNPPTARASGGPVSAGRMYRVGENGEEYFKPSVDGTIIPNDQVRNAKGQGGGSGGDVHLHIDARGADAAAVARIERAVRQIDSGFASRVVGTVQGMQTRRTGV